MDPGSGENGQSRRLEGIPRPGDVIAGKFAVERVVGVGGMGAVLAARHVHLDVLVAIKFLLPEWSHHAGAVDRFLREARATVRIQSEHVVRVIDVGTHEESGTPYVVMEYLSGSDLQAVLKKRGPLPIREAVDYVLQACDGVAHAHALGIVHRDLKPANLFLARQADGTPRIKVVDFGISKCVRIDGPVDLTRTNTFVGSPLYMSPEQLRNAKGVDERCDIWALGVITHQLLSNRCPFEAEDVLEVCARILSEPPAPLRAHRADAPEELERILLRCLEKTLERRMGSVAELARALAPFASPDGARLAERIAGVAARGSVSVEEAKRDVDPFEATVCTEGPTASEGARQAGSGVPARGAPLAPLSGGERSEPVATWPRARPVWLAVGGVVGLLLLAAAGMLAVSGRPRSPSAVEGGGTATPPGRMTGPGAPAEARPAVPADARQDVPRPSGQAPPAEAAGQDARAEKAAGPAAAASRPWGPAAPGPSVASPAPQRRRPGQRSRTEGESSAAPPAARLPSPAPATPAPTPAPGPRPVDPLGDRR